MTRFGALMLSVGLALFVGLVAATGLPAISATLAQAGWGLLLVALFHGVPLALDAAAICVVFPRGASAAPFRHAFLARWAGESANSLMPAGQIGGLVVMARQLAVQGMSLHGAAAAITVSTTLQTLAQIGFALMGVTLLGLYAGAVSTHASKAAALLASGVLLAQVAGFYVLQRRGLFGGMMRPQSSLRIRQYGDGAQCRPMGAWRPRPAVDGRRRAV